MTDKPISTQTEPIATEIPVEPLSVGSDERGDSGPNKEQSVLKLPESDEVRGRAAQVGEAQEAFAMPLRLEGAKEASGRTVPEIGPIETSARAGLDVEGPFERHRQATKVEAVREHERETLEMQPETKVTRHTGEEGTEVLARGFQAIERLEKAVRRFERRSR
ncbi:MAG: hypothetical protein U5N86_04595 [Planctomycetota bacterium]|nr:hypothetical protein [Planctomycetota bacterium]